MFKDLLKRADCANIEEFIMNGGELTELPKEQTNKERIAEAYDQIYSFIESNLKEESRDEKADNLISVISVLESSYFELGLLSGIKIGAQLQKKMAEIL